MSKRIDITRWSHDPKITTPAELKDALRRDLTPAVAEMRLLRNRCLVATYIRPERTAGGIIQPVKVLEEDRWQAVAGLLLKSGPGAFMFDEVMERIEEIMNASLDNGKFTVSYGDAELAAWDELNIPFLGDWVVFRAAETHEIGVNGASCRIISDDSIIMKVSDPTVVW